MLDKRDTILQAQCPTVMAPKFGTLDALTDNGHRFVVAADGLWMEVRRPWLYLLQPIAVQNDVAMPYGELVATINLASNFGPALWAALDRFEREAIAALPNEHAAWLIWDSNSGTLEYRMPTVLSAGAGHIRYERPTCRDGEHPAVDIHSHGRLGAFFSQTDDEDDRNELKLSIVIGELGQQASVATRLCAHGLLLDLEW